MKAMVSSLVSMPRVMLPFQSSQLPISFQSIQTLCPRFFKVNAESFDQFAVASWP